MGAKKLEEKNKVSKNKLRNGRLFTWDRANEINADPIDKQPQEFSTPKRTPTVTRESYMTQDRRWLHVNESPKDKTTIRHSTLDSPVSTKDKTVPKYIIKRMTFYKRAMKLREQKDQTFGALCTSDIVKMAIAKFPAPSWRPPKNEKEEEDMAVVI